MNHFWSFARRMLAYRRLLTLGGVAALIDAACAFAGIGLLLMLIDQIFEQNRTVREIAAEHLANDRLQAIFGNGTVRLAEYIPASQFAGFATALGIILLFALVGSVMRYLYQSTAISVSLRTVMTIRKEAYHRLLHAPIEQIYLHGSADNLSRIVRDCHQLGRGFNALMGKAVRDILMGLVALSLALLVDWRLTALFLVGLAIVYVCIRKFGKKIRRASKYAMRAFGGMTGAIQESIQALPVVKLHNAEGYERRRFNTINRKVFQQEMKARTVRALSSPVVELIGMVGVMAVSLVAAYYVFETETGDARALAKVLLLLGLAGASVKPLANLNNDLQEAAAAAGRIDELLQFSVEPNTRAIHHHDLPALPRHQSRVHFDAVSYAYPGSDRAAVDHVTLDVSHGQTVAIVGPNGAGKSTLLNLLTRLVEPTGGRITIDGTDIMAVSLRSLRRQIAAVSQHSVVFAGTIADNIAYGRRYVPREQIEQAARSAHAHEFIDALPDGYDTPLGEGGVGLSGGQKQRLCIARAILRDPAILILDEATSQVDADSEANITSALATFQQGRTTFVIAHRLSTVVDADVIVVMEDGRIIDQGRHDELLGRCATYQVLTRTQLAPSTRASAT